MESPTPDSPCDDVLTDLDVQVKAAVQRLDTDLEECYKMGSRPKGYALVISIEQFKWEIHDAREGARKDRDNLEPLLTQLGYVTVIRENLGRDEFKSAVLEFRDKPELAHVDSTIVFILTHGRTGDGPGVQFIANDNLEVNSEWVIDQFDAVHCPGLNGKPKLFFFQCCRGNEHETVLKAGPILRTSRTVTDSATVPRSTTVTDSARIQNKTDKLIVYACAPGTVALRSPDYGSWLVYYVCKVFMEDARDTDVMTMLNKVSREIMENYTKLKSTEVMCWNSRGFDRKMFFNPGLYYD